jgi:toxin-antitoxin system PIN domain toxin
VILVDANLLVYARVASVPQHDAARDWLDARLNGSTPVGLPWPSLLGFVRITTNPRIFERPLAVAAAWTQVQEWLDCRPAWIPVPTERHVYTLGRLLLESGITANLVPDAHLAALALEHGLALCSTDGDFARFPGLRWENPLRG